MAYLFIQKETWVKHALLHQQGISDSPRPCQQKLRHRNTGSVQIRPKGHCCWISIYTGIFCFPASHEAALENQKSLPIDWFKILVWHNSMCGGLNVKSFHDHIQIVLWEGTFIYIGRLCCKEPHWVTFQSLLVTKKLPVKVHLQQQHNNSP